MKLRSTGVPKNIAFLLILAVFVAQSAPLPSYALTEKIAQKFKSSDQPVVVNGDKVEYFHDQKKVVGQGNVSISYGDAKLTCNTITVYTDTKEAICEGNVRISQPGALMTGEKIHYNFSEKRGYALESRLQAKPFYGNAAKIEQTGEEEFGLEKGYVTTCDREKPHYRIEAKEIRIYLGKKIVAKHILFYIGKVPVFYMPVYVQPLMDDNRPEVTIVPGRTSDWGYYALTAWRYYFDDDAKGNIHLDYREKKGMAEGFTHSYGAKQLGNGIVKLYYTHENDDLTISRTGRADDRWRAQVRHLIDLPEDTTCTIEFNKVSDEEFVKDYLYREYEENPVPDNYILIETRKPNYVAQLLARKRMDTFFDVVERLPEFTMEVYNQRLWQTNFYYQSRNSATYFVKRYNEYYVSETRSPDESLRADNYHGISYASKLFGFLFVTPFAATRQTYYSVNRWKDTSKLRSIYEGGVDVSTKFYKTIDVTSNILGLDINRMRHIITPTVKYLHRHQPTISPDNLYQFDALDAIEAYNGFDLALENKLQTKRSEGGLMKTVDLATLIVSTDYLFKLKKMNIEPQGVGRFGDLKFKLELRPYAWLSVDSDMRIDHKDYDIQSANIDVFIDQGEKFTLGIGHRYESSETERASQITGQMSYRINDQWRVQTYQRYDIESQKWEEQEYTIYKDLHCWTAEVSYNKRNDDHIVWVVFRLKAFPNIPLGLFRTTYQRPSPGGRR